MRCGQCQKLIRFSAEMGGKSANCTACNALIQVPHETDPRHVTRVHAPVQSKEVARTELIKFFCHFCGQRLGVSHSLAGEQFTCPDCNESNHVPAASDSGDDFEVAVADAPSGLNWLVPVIMIVVIIAVGLVVYRMSGALGEGELLTEQYPQGTRLTLRRTETLDLVLTDPAGKKKHLLSSTELSAVIDILTVDALGAPSEFALTIRTQGRGDHRVDIRPKQLRQQDKTWVGWKLTVKPDGAVQLPQNVKSSGGKLLETHVTGWVFSERAFLPASSSGRNPYTLPEKDARKVLTSAFLGGFESTKVTCALRKSEKDSWTLKVEFGGFATIGEKKVRLTGTGEVIYLPGLKMVKEVRLEATVTAKDFEQPGDSLHGRWSVHLLKQRQN